MSADNIENKTTAFLTVAFLRSLRPYFNLLYFVALPIPSRWISPLATNFLILSDAIMSSMYPKAEEIFSEKESMIGILGKKMN